MRDGEDKKGRKEYLIYALSQIDDNTVWSETEQELSGHIDDREQYFKDCGYDDEQAAQMAVERMGSPEAAADGFSKVHNKTHKIISVIFALLSAIIVFFIFWTDVIVTIDDSEMGMGIAEALLLIYLFGLAAVGKRQNSQFICFTAILSFIMTLGAYLWLIFVDFGINSLCSRIVFKLVCLFTFDFKALNTFWQVGGITVAPYLTCLSIAFYLAVFILLILIFKSVGTLKDPTYTLKEKHFTNRVFKTQKVSVLFIAATMLILPVFAPFDKDEGMTVKIQQEYCGNVVIAQSDSPKPISEIPIEDRIVFTPNYDWSVYILEFNYRSNDDTEPKNIALSWEDAYIGQNLITKKCGNKFQYQTVKSIIPLIVTKDYIYVEFVNDYPQTICDENAEEFVSDASENWYKTDSTDKITAAIDAYNQVEITVSKAE